jgi:hypothetical protein
MCCAEKSRCTRHTPEVVQHWSHLYNVVSLLLSVCLVFFYLLAKLIILQLNLICCAARSLAGITGSNPAGNVVCCQVEVSATGWSLVQRSLTECACVWVWSVATLTLYTCNEYAERGHTKKERKKERKRKTIILYMPSWRGQGQLNINTASAQSLEPQWPKTWRWRTNFELCTPLTAVIVRLWPISVQAHFFHIETDNENFDNL